MTLRCLGDPPNPGTCKLKITSSGTWDGTRVLVVDDLGVERELLGAIAASWKLDKPGDPPIACVRVIESEVYLDVESSEISPAGEVSP